MVTARKPAKPRKAAPRSKKAKEPFDAFRYLMERGDALPDEVIARMPRDGAQYFDDYLEGVRKDPAP